MIIVYAPTHDGTINWLPLILPFLQSSDGRRYASAVLVYSLIKTTARTALLETVSLVLYIV